jgi:hypothetical protein
MRRSSRWGWLALSVVAPFSPGPAIAQHACDNLGDAGWRTEATVETVAENDGPPYRAAAGNWYVERKSTVLPFCNYYNSLGNYSLRSYSLSPEDKVERVEICHADAPDARPVAVGTYKGACPPG